MKDQIIMREVQKNKNANTSLKMKNRSPLILAILFFYSCNLQEEKSKKVDMPCVKLNDLALTVYQEENDVDKALELINTAIACDPWNSVFSRNKVMFLANKAMFQELIDFMETKQEHFTRVEYLSTIAECYLNLNNPTMFDTLKVAALLEAEKMFDQNKNENNLITYVYTLKRFDGEEKMKKVLNEHKKLFSQPDNMYSHVLESTDKVSTLVIE